MIPSAIGSPLVTPTTSLKQVVHVFNMPVNHYWPVVSIFSWNDHRQIHIVGSSSNQMINSIKHSLADADLEDITRFCREILGNHQGESPIASHCYGRFSIAMWASERNQGSTTRHSFAGPRPRRLGLPSRTRHATGHAKRNRGGLSTGENMAPCYSPRFQSCFEHGNLYFHAASWSYWLTIIMMSHVVTSGWCLIVVWKGKQLENPAVSKLQLDGRAP